ncbi:MAG: hypothetical protein K2K64_01750 [Muribaculaceae bacterium]|nr:hypothetical protein [Muribaculaceae bacterium]MDE7108572.1 hypothetical protein [Muribaculaceae bacterium]
MKKFYALAAAAFMAVSAFAQNGAPLYATGAGPAFEPSWAPETPAEFKYADGVYTLELEGLTQFKISTAMGDWDTFNGGVYGCNYGTELGVAVALEAGFENNIETPGAGDYTVTVAGDLSTITLTAKGEIDTSFPAVYVRGDMNGWGAEEAWQMKEVVPETVFSITVPAPIAVGQAFKFADDAWNKINCGGDGEAIMVDTETEVFNGGNPANITLEEEFDGTIWLNLNLDGAAYVYFDTTDGEDVPEWVTDALAGVKGVEVDNNVAPVYYNLQGIKVANPENGIFIQVKGNKVSKVVR